MVLHNSGKSPLLGLPMPRKSRRPGAAGPRLSRRPVGRRCGVDPPFARSEWSDPGVVLGRDARSFVPRRWAQGRGPQLGTDAAVQRVDATGVGVPREYASEGTTRNQSESRRKMGYKGHDMRPFIVQSSQGNFPKSTPSKRGMTQPLTHSHVLEPRKITHNDF